MRQTDIADALRAHLAALQPRPRIVFLNYQSASGPRWETELYAAPPVRNGLSFYALRGRMIVRVYVPLNSGTQDAENQCEAIVARFPKDLALPFGDGRVHIIQPPHTEWIGEDVASGLNGTEYRMDVQVRWIAYDH